MCIHTLSVSLSLSLSNSLTESFSLSIHDVLKMSKCFVANYPKVVEPKLGLICQIYQDGKDEYPCVGFISKPYDGNDNVCIRILFPDECLFEQRCVPPRCVRKFDYKFHLSNLHRIAQHIILFLVQLLIQAARSKKKAVVLAKLADAVIYWQLQEIVDQIAIDNPDQGQTLVRCLEVVKARCLMLQGRAKEAYKYAAKV